MPYANPNVQKQYFETYYQRNRDRVRLSQKAWRESPRGAAHRFKKTLQKYSLTKFDWDAIWASQSGACAGCLSALVIGADTHIDHCHDSGRVRGLLCSSCNLAVGKIKDDPATLRRLADYLERSE